MNLTVSAAGLKCHRIPATLVMGLALLSGFMSMVPAQTQWTPSANNPVLNPGLAGAWDQNTVFLPCVIKTGDTLKMWFGGTDATVDQKRPQTGYAWSLDGISWTKYAGNPVLPKRAGEWDDGGVAPRAVIQDGDTLRMWYSGLSTNGPVGPGRNSAGYARSTDGINWFRLPSSVLGPGASGEWDSDIFEPGSVIKEGGIYKMWYSGGTGVFFTTSHSVSIGYATSSDGINWVKYNDTATTAPPYQESDPVLWGGPRSDFDATRAWTPVVRKTTSGYEMWYTGGNVHINTQAIMYATSPDGIHWSKRSEPVLQASGSWMSNHVIAPSVLFDKGQYHMWFSGFAAPNFITARIGYATAIVSSAGDMPDQVPGSFSLEQNYPNPFNPKTVVSSQLPVASDVRLVIYDLLGREVAVLVNERRAAGTYHDSFSAEGGSSSSGGDASGLASGVYLYRLTAGSFVRARKMVLLR